MLSGRPLGALAGLWLAGRLAPFTGNLLPMPLLALLDASFLLVLAAYLFRVLWKYRQKRNLVFPMLLAAMAASNVLSYAGIRNRVGAAVGTETMLWLVVLVVVLMGGRIIPSFTKNRFPQGTTRSRPMVNRWAIGLLVAALLSDIAAWTRPDPALLFGAAAIANGLRLHDWFTREIRTDPLIWILHLGYAWLVLGLALHAGGHLGWCNPLLARHAITVGAIGSITLGMMCRVTLGHTGRLIRASRLTNIAFVCVGLAATFRVLLPLVAPRAYLTGVNLSAVMWIVEFGLYLAEYGPILVKARMDGQPG